MGHGTLPRHALHFSWQQAQLESPAAHIIIPSSGSDCAGKHCSLSLLLVTCIHWHVDCRASRWLVDTETMHAWKQGLILQDVDIEARCGQGPELPFWTPQCWVQRRRDGQGATSIKCRGEDARWLEVCAGYVYVCMSTNGLDTLFSVVYDVLVLAHPSSVVRRASEPG